MPPQTEGEWEGEEEALAQRWGAGVVGREEPLHPYLGFAAIHAWEVVEFAASARARRRRRRRGAGFLVLWLQHQEVVGKEKDGVCVWLRLN